MMNKWMKYIVLNPLINYLLKLHLLL